MRSLFYDALEPQLRWENDLRVPYYADRVAVLASWSLNPRLSRSLSELVRQVSGRGYFVLLVSACPDPAPLEWAGEAPERVAILRKPNIGYDFGSWAAAYLAQPQLFEADRVLQLNDSLLGPFDRIDAVLDDFEGTYGDWWGMLRSTQFRDHLQSFVLGFTPAVLQSPDFQGFWRGVRIQGDKDEVIRRYELGLSALLYGEGFAGTAFLEPQLVGTDHANPMITRWDAVLREGVPFIKRELITRPEIVPDGDRIPQRLRDEFGIEIADWL